MYFIPVFILVIIFTIIIDYFAGIFIEKNTGKKKKTFLIISLASNIGVLAFFKYYKFFVSGFEAAFSSIGLHNTVPYLNIILPLGLSFHTFQAMSYNIEVYRGNQKAERHFGIYSLYILFFPQMVAGPIERPQHMLPQFYEHHKFDPELIYSGLRLILIGLIKKVVLADRLAPIANNVFDAPHLYPGLPTMIAVIAFSFQIYYDFSGYTDIARGAARLMGFRLVKNFNMPYYSRSIREFWKRWHISLSTWFRDYLYIPLGGNRVSKAKIYFNLCAVFLISGLWHGASKMFIIWGLLHYIYFAFSMSTDRIRKKIVSALFINKLPSLHNTIKVLITFSIVTFAWIFFRAMSVPDAWYIITHLLPSSGSQLFPKGKTEIVIAFSLVALFEIAGYYFTRVFFKKNVLSVNTDGSLVSRSPKRTWENIYVAVRWFLYIAAILIILNFGMLQSRNQFIYFQF